MTKEVSKMLGTKYVDDFYAIRQANVKRRTDITSSLFSSRLRLIGYPRDTRRIQNTNKVTVSTPLFSFCLQVQKNSTDITVVLPFIRVIKGPAAGSVSLGVQPSQEGMHPLKISVHIA
jgi:hypothetical protein